MNSTPCQVMLFSGKGGVGKTTLAAATAVRSAHSGSRVLVMSTDPAHSLSDVFAVQLASKPLTIQPRLEAMEIDAKGMFTEVLDHAGQGLSNSKLGDLLRTMSETPGVDEFGAIEVLLEAIEMAEHDVVILDTAPTGHTLRLLMLPELMNSWLGKLLEMRYRIARAGRFLRRLFPGSQPLDPQVLNQDIESGRQRISRLRELLTDAQRAQIMLVTIPEAMSVLETSRTLEMLHGHSLPIGAIVVNQLQPSVSDCPHCARRREIHLRELEHLRTLAGPIPIRVLESLAWEIRGFQALQEIGEMLWRQ